MLDLKHADSGSLARLIGVDGQTDPFWRAEDLAEVLAHQLRAPLIVDLQDGEGVTRDVFSRYPGQIDSFGSLLHHPQPPIELLLLVKRFAKQFLNDSKGAIPREVATILYYAAIVVAITRCKQRISDLEPAELDAGIYWALRQAWVDPATHALFEDGLRELANLSKGKP